MRLVLGQGLHPKERSGTPLLVSVVLHLVIGAIVAAALAVPGFLAPVWRLPGGERHKPERVRFIELTPPSPQQAPAATSPSAPAPRSAAPLRAPSRTPGVLPPPEAPPAGAATERGGAGSGLGVANGLRGLVPDYSDPRIWREPEPADPPVRTRTELIDSAIVAAIAGAQDSLAEAARQLQPPSWTVERGGKKYGLDQSKIYLGSFSIPAALLALLPINQQGNPIVTERERFLAYQRADIVYHAQRAMNEQEFREAARRIRERKERERRRQEEQRKEVVAP